MRYEKDEMEIDLRELFFVLRRRILVIILTAVIFAGAAGSYSYFVADPVYESTSRLYIQTQSTSITSLADIQMSTVLANDYVVLIQSRTLCQEVIDNLDLDMGYKALQSKMTVTNPEDTRILNISIRDDDPQISTIIANEVARVAKKKISDVMKTDEPSLWETAIVPEHPIKPAKVKNTMLGGMIGAFLAALVVIVLHLMDDAIRTPEDVERYLGLTTLSSIPQEGETKKKRRKDRIRRSKSRNILGMSKKSKKKGKKHHKKEKGDNING